MRANQEDFELIPKWAKARLTSPAKFTTAKMMVRLDECSQTNSFNNKPSVPMIIRIKAVVLRKVLILRLIIAQYFDIFTRPLPFKEKRCCTPLKHPARLHTSRGYKETVPL